jgi:hypothetical protein
VPETMRICRAEGTLSDEASNSFPIIIPFSFLNVCVANTTKQQGKFGYQMKNDVADISGNFLILN